MRPIAEMSTVHPAHHGVVYLAVNRVNHKAYVGQTRIGLERRIAAHCHKSNTRHGNYFQRAIAKYGVESFDFAVLDNCPDAESLKATERRWISELGCFAPFGYNITAGGEGSQRETKTQKWRDSVTSPEYRKKHSDRVKSLRSRMSVEDPARAEQWRRNAADSIVGRAGRFGDDNVSRRPEVRAKISASKKGIKRPESLKAKLSHIAKAKWADPAYRNAVLSARRKGK